MPVTHYIAMDTHSYTTEICVKTRANGPARRWNVPTTIPAILEVIESIKRPRHLTFEEGPLAAWLYRNLKHAVDRALVCDPRKNAWISKGGDKDDPIDASKLNDLLAGGFLKAVHQTEDLSREVFKQLVGRYHERVARRVSEGNKIVGWLRRWGVMVTAKDFADKSTRAQLLGRLPADAELEPVRIGLELMLGGYDHAVKQETRLRRELIKRAKKEEFIVRLEELPGISWIRASTFFVYVDTPWRFAGKSALWKYMGIGLTRSTSGNGPQSLHVDRKINRRLKSMILGAAKTVLERNGPDDPFAQQHRRWKESGLTPRNARRNVARNLAAVAWGMWKNGGVYEPKRIGMKSSE
ncbi:MAG TPA: transposase [Rhizomicrobium sp.]|nr:transposase [Rhizomicrobium sp.]